jgi:hypothetical protein
VSRAAKWLVTGGGIGGDLRVCLWLAALIKVPFLPKADADQ